MGILGIILGIVILILLTWRGWHMGFSTIIASLAVILLNRLDVWYGISELYSPKFQDFAGTWFLLFALGAIFGELMSQSRAATSVSNAILNKLGKDNIVLIVLLTTGVLAYGGISVFIIAYTMYPICMALFKEADIPRKIFPAISICMAGTVCMTFLPGSPAVQNLIPTEFLGTTIYAAPKMGVIAGIFVFFLHYFFLKYEVKKLRNSGEHFVALESDTMLVRDENSLPEVWKSFAPIIVLIISSLVLVQIIDSANFAIILAMSLACLTAIILLNKNFNAKEAIGKGFSNGFNSIVVTSSIMGFGGVVSGSPAFGQITDYILGLEMNPLLLAIFSINIIALITGSASGGNSIFWSSLGDYMLTTGINPQVLHRITSVACSGLDAMPYSSGIVVANEVGRSELKDSYKYMFITNAVNPLIGLLLALLLYKIGII